MTKKSVLAVVVVGLMAAGLSNCTSSKDSSPASPSTPPPKDGGNGGGQKGSGNTEKSFEETVKSTGVAVKINDSAFMSKLNHETSRFPIWVQHGKLLLGDGFLKRDEPNCSFAIGNGFTDNYSFYQVDADSLKQVGLFGAHVIRYSMGKLFASECTTSADRDLTLSDFQEIVGNLLTVVSGTTPANPGNNSGPLGKKIDLLKGQDGSPQIGIQYATAAQKAVAVTFSIRGNQLVGNKDSMISPSYLAIMNKDTGSFYVPWADTGLGNSYISPGSSQAFTMSVSDPAKVAELVRSLRNSAIVISVKNPTPSPTVYIDLKDLCTSNPEKFVNLDTGASGCP